MNLYTIDILTTSGYIPDRIFEITVIEINDRNMISNPITQLIHSDTDDLPLPLLAKYDLTLTELRRYGIYKFFGKLEYVPFSTIAFDIFRINPNDCFVTYDVDFVKPYFDDAGMVNDQWISLKNCFNHIFPSENNDVANEVRYRLDLGMNKKARSRANNSTRTLGRCWIYVYLLSYLRKRYTIEELIDMNWDWDK